MIEKNILSRLPEDWNEINEIVIYGFGRTAVINIDKLAQMSVLHYRHILFHILPDYYL